MDLKTMATWALLTCACMGCQGGDQGPETLLVSGVVTQDGAPVEGAMVLFHPEKKGVGIKVSSGETDAQGKFELESHVSGSTYKPGAQAGEYRVSIEKQDRSQVYKTMSAPKDMLPVKYKDPATSGFTATVSADGDNSFEFNLE